MSKSKVWVPALVGAATVGALAYAYSRRARREGPHSAGRNAQPLGRALIDNRERSGGEALREFSPLDLDGVFEGDSSDALAADDAPTAQRARRVPPLTNADDAEPPSPDELGAYWLKRVAESEHSSSEADLVLELEELQIAAPSEEEDLDEGDRLSAEAWRG